MGRWELGNQGRAGKGVERGDASDGTELGQMFWFLFVFRIQKELVGMFLFSNPQLSGILPRVPSVIRPAGHELPLS